MACCCGRGDGVPASGLAPCLRSLRPSSRSGVFRSLLIVYAVPMRTALRGTGTTGNWRGTASYNDEFKERDEQIVEHY